MHVTIRYRYPSNEKKDTEATTETETFEVDQDVFERAMALLSMNSQS